MIEGRSRSRITQIVALMAMLCVSTSCSARPGPPTVTPQPTKTASVSTDIEIPSTSEAEIARSAASGEPLRVESVLLKAAETGVDYDVEAACAAGDEMTSVSYRISGGGTTIGTGTILCDGTVYRNAGLTGTGRAARVILDDPPSGVTRAFARLVEADR